MKNRFPRLHSALASRFTPGEEFGLHLTVGVALMLVAAWIFGVIAGEVVAQAGLTLLDARLAEWFHRHTDDAWTPFILFLTHMHNTVGVLALASLLALHFYLRRALYWLLTVALVVPGGMLLNVLLKYTFQRARPSFDEPLLTLATYSFPSGHALGATVLYGVLAAYAVCVARTWPTRAFAVVFACLMVALVAFSRVYLGVHYLSDVLAAMAEGCAWLAVCITGVSTLRRRRASVQLIQAGGLP